MTTAHSLAERLRARADAEDIAAERAHITAETPAEATVAMQHEYSARVLREEAAALDALTPDPELGEAEEREDALADIVMGALNDAHKASVDNEIDEQAVVDAFLVRFRKLGWQPTAPPVDLRREVAERIAADVWEAAFYEATIVQDAEREAYVRGFINPILDKHLSADDEERAAEREVVEAALSAEDAKLLLRVNDGNCGRHSGSEKYLGCADCDAMERSARGSASDALFAALDALRAVRARRKT